jgi:hypothetical protein
MSKQMTVKQSIIFVIVIAIAVFIAMQVVYGQTNNDTETRTFKNCYSDTAMAILLRNMIYPDPINLMDPEVRQFISDACNFYHEKTGIYPDSSDRLNEEYMQKMKPYWQEFNDRYTSKLSPELKEKVDLNSDNSKEPEIKSRVIDNE